MKYFQIISICIFFLSCSKNSDDDAAKQKALTSGSWKLTGQMRDYQKDGVYEEDTYKIFDECIKDNIYTFQADGTLIFDEGPTKCSSNHPQTSTSTWSFKDKKSQLIFQSTTYQIEELTNSTLKLKATIPYNIIYTINVKSTFSKQ